MLLGDGGDVVHRHVEKLEVPVGAELHVVDPLETDVDAQAFRGPPGVHEDAFSVAVSEAVVGVGVVDLPDVLAHELEAALLDLGAVPPGPDIVGQLEDKGVLGDGAARLESADEAGPEGDPGAGGGEPFEGVVEVDFTVHGADGAGTVDQAGVEVEALLADETLEGHPVRRAENEPEAVEGIVDAELPLLIGSEQKAGAELLVEVAEGDLEVLFGVVRVAIAHAGTAEAAGVAEDGVEVALVPHAGGEVAARVDEVAESVEPGLSRRDLGADQGVLLVGLEQELDVAGDLAGVDLVLLCCGGTGDEQGDHGRREQETLHHSASFRSSS